MQFDHKLKDFLIDYNELLSRAALELKGQMGALANPTLNKQETVTLLYQDVVNYSEGHTKKIKKNNLFMLRVKFLVRMLLMFINLFKTSTLFRVKSIPKNCIYINTWLEPRCVKGESLQDDFFRKLIFDLEGIGPTIVSFNVIDFSILKKVKKIDVPSNYIISIGLLGLTDIIQLMINYYLNAKIKLKNNYLFKGVDVTNVINMSLIRDYYELRSFYAFLSLKIAEKVKYFQPSSYFYIFENQSWEKIYLKVLKNSPTKTFGYQSSGFSFRFLNFFPSSTDAANSLFPDVILTVGDNFTKILKKYGNYPVPVHTFGALRFNYETKKDKYIINKPSRKIHKRLLYAFPVCFYQYDSIVRALQNTFGGSPIEVHLKFHPQYKISDLKKKYPNLPGNMRLVDDIKANLLTEEYDCVLFNDNSFGIEALISGVRVYEYNTEEIWDQSRLFYFNGYNYQISERELVELKNEIIGEKFHHINKEELIYTENYINQCYTPYKFKNSEDLNEMLNNYVHQ